MKGSEKYVIQYTCVVLCEMYGMKCGQIHNMDMAKYTGSVIGERARRYLVMFMETRDIVEVA